MGKKLNLYTDRSWLAEGQKCIPLLFPFWGDPETDQSDPDFGRFDEYCKDGAGLFSISDTANDAGFYLLPYEFSFEEEYFHQALKIAAEAAQANKQIILFFNSDLQEEISIPNAVVFRTSFSRGTRKPNEFAMPGWSQDFKKLHSANEVPSSKPQHASVGYCGYVDYLFWGDPLYWATFSGRLTGKVSPVHRIGPRLRGKLVRQLKKDPRIKTDFIIRSGFWAGGMDRRQARREYVSNMFGSDYALVTRGGGNFSYRLYETLSCGRIPLFLDTDCVLPFDHLVSWKDHMVWIREQEMDSAAEKLVTFHERISEKDFLQLKQDCRKLYEEYICPLGFFKNLHRCLQ